MGHYNSTMIGIRTGGVFAAGEVDMPALRKRIQRVVVAMQKEFDAIFDARPVVGWAPSVPKKINIHCISKKLCAQKGSYVVIAGVFNYWFWDSSSEFARRLSDEFQTEVMIMAWDEETGQIDSGIFLAGKPLNQQNENWIHQAIRRVT